MIHVDNKQIVVPGELIATGDTKFRYGTEKDGKNIYSTVVGITYANPEKDYIKVVPLEGKYIPRRGDNVIGLAEEFAFKKAILDINSAKKGILDVRDATRNRNAEIDDIFSIGDVIYSKVSDTNDSVTLNTKNRLYGKLQGGRLINIPSAKIPRVIGRKGSMISTIKKHTQCKIYVGQNGTIWVKGKDKKEELALEAIKTIDAESHISGLTKRITNFLKKER
ncbi:MAG: exosome complex RNA-binding protein Rrp4 [Euryarchaeota archaeon]|nr:exosome complex RNA-binding protein Rrp4 [Euryarchaeota archaeon]